MHDGARAQGRQSMNTSLKPKHEQKTNRKPKANKPVVKKQQNKQPP
ncbi:TPA: 23S rRNA (adenine(1618)-N(6))-methyltransferase RlmF, partial [Vibrio cholerae]